MLPSQFLIVPEARAAATQVYLACSSKRNYQAKTKESYCEVGTSRCNLVSMVPRMETKKRDSPDSKLLCVIPNLAGESKLILSIRAGACKIDNCV